MKRCVVGMLALVALLAVMPARAGMIVNIGGTISGGVLTGGTNYTDNQVGVDANPGTGIMDIGTFLSGVSVNFVINEFGATSGHPIANITMNTNSNLATAAVLPLFVDITISDTGFTSPPTPLHMTQTVNLLSSVGGVTADATAKGYYGASNTNFDVSGLNTGFAMATVSGGVGTNLIATSGSISGPTPYSMTTAVHLDVTARGTDPIENLQLNANLSAAGETVEISTWLMIASGFGLLAYRFKKLKGSVIHPGAAA